MGQLTAEEAYDRLKKGNERFLSGTINTIGRDSARRKMLAKSQEPFAVILCCADSRVVPEIVFDTGLGELFVIRVAGNVANTCSIASIEYAVANLNTKLVVVMAHGNCGAIAAALAGGDASKNLRYLLDYIQPAVDRSEDRDVDAIARLNTRLSADRLIEESEIIAESVDNDGARIVGAFYCPETGKAELA